MNLKGTASKSLAILLLLSLCGCPSSNSSSSGSSVTQKGSRVLGMDTNDAAQDFTFLQSYDAAQSIGVGASTVHLTWSEDEAAGSGTTSGTFTDTNSQLADTNAFYPTTNPASLVSLTVGPIDTGAMELPSDLSGMTMNNATVITRFNKFMDWVLTQLPNVSFTSIQIGNEIDTLSAANTSAYWTQYQTFLAAVVSHLHSVKPGVKIGVTVTLYGLIGQGGGGTTAKNGAISLASVGDEIGLTYYPLDSSAMMKDPTVVATETAQVFTLLPSTQIYFQEVGYATSSTCGGSTANQVTFVDQIFSMWDSHCSQVPFLSFVRMNDYSAANASSVAAGYGFGGNAAFTAYLQTLGFRTYPTASSSKSGWTELQTQTRLRGW